MDDSALLNKCQSQGLCCAQIMVQMGLWARNEDNAQFVQAMGGLCNGLQTGLTCGALTGTVCLLSLFDLDLAKREMIPELVDWFVDQYGSQDCLVILKGSKQSPYTFCPNLIEKTYLFAKELLLDKGFDFGDQL